MAHTHSYPDDDMDQPAGYAVSARQQIAYDGTLLYVGTIWHVRDSLAGWLNLIEEK